MAHHALARREDIDIAPAVDTLPSLPSFVAALLAATGLGPRSGPQSKDGLYVQIYKPARPGDLYSFQLWRKNAERHTLLLGINQRPGHERIVAVKTEGRLPKALRESIGSFFLTAYTISVACDDALKIALAMIEYLKENECVRGHA